jgi:hypothetical protein
VDEADRRAECGVARPVAQLGTMHEAGRTRRGIVEFLRLPLLIMVGFCVVGVLLVVVDATARAADPLRSLMTAVVPEHGAVEFVATAAASVVTVTSITFSVLLAVQETASNLTPVVFDQFLRRVANQVYFGFSPACPFSPSWSRARHERKRRRCTARP